jgi:hypothetical protein
VAGSVGDGYFVSCGGVGFGVVVCGGSMVTSVVYVAKYRVLLCGECVFCGGSMSGGGIMVCCFVFGFRVVVCGFILGSRL